MFFSADQSFCVIFGSILAYAPLFLFLENHSIFSHGKVYRCSWYYSDGQYTFFDTMSILAGGHLGYFWTYFFMFLHFLRTVQYFIMKLCTHVLGSTLMITSPKNMSCSTLLEVRPFWGVFYFGLFWYIYVPLFLENCSIFSHKIL